MKFKITVMQNSLTGFWHWCDLTVTADNRAGVEAAVRAVLGSRLRKICHITPIHEPGQSTLETQLGKPQ